MVAVLDLRWTSEFLSNLWPNDSCWGAVSGGCGHYRARLLDTMTTGRGGPISALTTKMCCSNMGKRTAQVGSKASLKEVADASVQTLGALSMVEIQI